MKTRSLLTLTVAVFVAATSFSRAEEDTARHKALFKAINAKEKTLKKVTASHKEEEVTFSLTGYLEGDTVVKIVATTSDELKLSDEYYLENGDPVFIFSTWNKLDDKGKVIQRVEERFYFSMDKSISTWLTTEKNHPVFHSEDYASMANSFGQKATDFAKTLKKSGK